MDGLLEQMRLGPRKIAVPGHFGSGKTEFAVSLAFALAACERGGETLAPCDLDIENPYFRSRERQDALREAGVAVYSDPFGGHNGSELQTISAAIRTPLEDENCRVILDCGGDASGAMILRQFGKYFADDYRLLCVVNPNRPGTDSVEKAAEHIRAIEASSGLAVTGLLSNAHLIYMTEAETVREGWAFTQKVASLTGVPALGACCMRALCPSLADCGFPLFPVGMYMRDTYLDKQV